MAYLLQQPFTPLMPGRFQFEYVGLIGEGGLGRVDRIRITASNAAGKPVGSGWAVKRLNSRWEAHPEMQQRFEREIGALKRMSHGNIITFEGENLPGGQRFYVMRIFPQSLRKLIASGSMRGNWREVARHGATLAAALQYAHNQGFIHRDFKPDNVLFETGGPLTIADWGLGYFVHKRSVVLQHLTVGGMGTEYYCSAEQWATGKCDYRGDIYSLGMTLDEWVTGRQRSISVGDGLPRDATPSGGLTVGGMLFDAAVRRMTGFASRGRQSNMAAVAAELLVAANTP